MPQLKTASTRRAKRRDTLARWVITLGGVTVIASVIAILALIVGVTVRCFGRRGRTSPAFVHFPRENRSKMQVGWVKRSAAHRSQSRREPQQESQQARKA